MSAPKEHLLKKYNLTDTQWKLLVDKKREEMQNPVFSYTDLSLDEAKTLKKREMNFRCEKAIVEGFTSANGNHYRTNRDDQTNMIGQYNALVADSTITSVHWKTENVGYVEHTRDEWLSVYQEAFTHKQVQLFKYDDLKKQIDACLTVDEVIAIVW